MNLACIGNLKHFAQSSVTNCPSRLIHATETVPINTVPKAGDNPSEMNMFNIGIRTQCAMAQGNTETDKHTAFALTNLITTCRLQTGHVLILAVIRITYTYIPVWMIRSRPNWNKLSSVSPRIFTRMYCTLVSCLIWISVLWILFELC